VFFWIEPRESGHFGGKMEENKTFWVLENNSMPLYFGICNKRAHWAVGIDNAIKFYSQHSAYMMMTVLNDLGYGTNHKVTEHSYMKTEGT
jgi:hypothetical protein